jgi:hypothetical protein
MIMIRKEVSEILGFSIPSGGWEKVIQDTVTMGVFDNKKMIKLIILLCEHLERLEGDESKATLQPVRQVSLYNPTARDFETTYDVKGTKQPEKFVIHSKEIETFDRTIGEHLLKHLIVFVLNERTMENTDVTRSAVEKEVVVNI